MFRQTFCTVFFEPVLQKFAELWRLGASDLGDTELVEIGSCTEEFMISYQWIQVNVITASKSPKIRLPKRLKTEMI